MECSSNLATSVEASNVGKYIDIIILLYLFHRLEFISKKRPSQSETQTFVALCESTIKKISKNFT